MAFAWVFALCTSAASAQDAEMESVPAASEMTIAELSESVSNKLASLREFESYPMPGLLSDAEPLRFVGMKKPFTCSDASCHLRIVCWHFPRMPQSGRP